MDGDRVLELAAAKGILRARDVTAIGIARAVLSRLTEAGKLVRLDRGLYALPDATPSKHHAIALASKQVPQAIVCLFSALVVHELTDQSVQRQLRWPPADNYGGRWWPVVVAV